MRIATPVVRDAWGDCGHGEGGGGWVVGDGGGSEFCEGDPRAVRVGSDCRSGSNLLTPRLVQRETRYYIVSIDRCLSRYTTVRWLDK